MGTLQRVIRPAPKILDAFGTLLRLGLAVVWLVAGLPKVGDINQNYLAVRAYELFPATVSRLIGGVQPFVEIALGVLLLVGIGVRLVSVISALILLAYIAGIIQAWARGLSIDCGCFSGGGQVATGDTRYPVDIARDVGFVAMATWLAVRPRSLLALDTVFFGRPQTG